MKTIRILLAGVLALALRQATHRHQRIEKRPQPRLAPPGERAVSGHLHHPWLFTNEPVLPTGEDRREVDHADPAGKPRRTREGRMNDRVINRCALWANDLAALAAVARMT